MEHTLDYLFSSMVPGLIWEYNDFLSHGFQDKSYTINALAPLSYKILIVRTLEFLFSSEVVGLIWEFVEILPCSIGGKITPKILIFY